MLKELIHRVHGVHLLTLLCQADNLLQEVERTYTETRVDPVGVTCLFSDVAYPHPCKVNKHYFCSNVPNGNHRGHIPRQQGAAAFADLWETYVDIRRALGLLE